MYRVLIADDEPIECQGLEMMMKNYFEDVEISGSLSEQLHSVSETLPPCTTAVPVSTTAPNEIGISTHNFCVTVNEQEV